MAIKQQHKQPHLFESRRQKLLPFSAFLMRVLHFGCFAFLLIVASVLLGTWGYMHFAKLRFLDAFYMACMILTGMGPVSDMPNKGAKLFSALYALYSGLAFLTISAVVFTPVIHRVLHILHVEDNTEN